MRSAGRTLGRALKTQNLRLHPVNLSERFPDQEKLLRFVISETSFAFWLTSLPAVVSDSPNLLKNAIPFPPSDMITI